MRVSVRWLLIPLLWTASPCLAVPIIVEYDLSSTSTTTMSGALSTTTTTTGSASVDFRGINLDGLQVAPVLRGVVTGIQLNLRVVQAITPADTVQFDLSLTQMGAVSGPIGGGRIHLEAGRIQVDRGAFTGTVTQTTTCTGRLCALLDPSIVVGVPLVENFTNIGTFRFVFSDLAPGTTLSIDNPIVFDEGIVRLPLGGREIAGREVARRVAEPPSAGLLALALLGLGTRMRRHKGCASA